MAKQKPELNFNNTATQGGPTGLPGAAAEDDRNSLQKDGDALLRITFPETFNDPSGTWANELLRVDINIEEGGVPVASLFSRRAQEFMYRSVRTICTEGEAEKFTMEEWEQLVASMTLTALSEDEVIAPLLTDKIRDWLKEIVKKYVAEDNFILDTMEMIASIRLERQQAEKVTTVEKPTPGEQSEELVDKSDAVFLLKEGKVVKDEVSIPEGQIKPQPLESEGAVQVLKDFVSAKKREGRQASRPSDVYQASSNLVNGLIELWAR